MTRLRAYAQLVRLPNLPTALADICLAALASSFLVPPGRAQDLARKPELRTEPTRVGG